MSLLLDLVLQIVDAPQQLSLRFDWLLIAEPECVHLQLLELEVALATLVGAHEGDSLC